MTTTCGCGCGQPMTPLGSGGRPRTYLVGHNNRRRDRPACENCGIQLQHAQKRYCSRTCASRARAATVARTCQLCGTAYDARPSERTRYCSKACWEVRAGTTSCEGCGVEVRPAWRSFCTRECARQHMVGARATRYRDGTSLRGRNAHRTELGRWRKAVLQRDNYTCRDCGTHRLLHAHHLLPWASHPHARFDLNNGVTVCLDCHGKRHGRRLGGGWSEKR